MGVRTRRRHRCLRVLTLAGLLLAGAGRAAADGAATADLNGDDVADLVVGAPGASVSGLPDAGAVTIVVGGPSAVASIGGDTPYLTQAAWKEPVEADDLFGAALAMGDFDGDGRTDLVVAAPGEDLDGHRDAGLVLVRSGPVAAGTGRSYSLSQHFVVPGAVEAGDLLGATLTVGDFNGDGFDDLVVGIPGEDLGALAEGAAAVLYGGRRGLAEPTARLAPRLVSQDAAGSTRDFDGFAAALAAGDLDGDGYDELIVGVPGDDLGDAVDAGSVRIFRGSRSGLSPDSQLVTQRGVVGGEDRTGDRFGSAIAVGDLDRDGRQDLAIGVPGRSVGGAAGAGRVIVLAGGPTGVHAPGTIVERGARAGGSPGPGESFGAAVMLHDLDGDDRADLVVGAPQAAGEGRVLVLTGGANGGVRAPGVELKPPAGSAFGAVGSRFGAHLRAVDLDGDGTADLAIAAPDAAAGSGAVFAVVLPAAAGSVEPAATAPLPRLVLHSSPGAPQPGDHFGAGL